MAVGKEGLGCMMIIPIRDSCTSYVHTHCIALRIYYQDLEDDGVSAIAGHSPALQ